MSYNGGGSSSSSKRKEEEEEGWESTLLKVAGGAAAAATVFGGLYALFKQPQPEPVPVPVQASGFHSVQRRPTSGWTKPKPGWIKLNVDGSLRLHSAGCGGVLRDSFGNWVSGFAVKLEPRSHFPDQTEKAAISSGLQWAFQRGEKRVAVESDHRGTVDFVKSGAITTHPLVLQIRDFLYNKQSEWEVTLDWIPGDANRVADKLADYARGLSSFDLIEFDSPPDSCRYDLMADSQ